MRFFFEPRTIWVSFVVGFLLMVIAGMFVCRGESSKDREGRIVGNLRVVSGALRHYNSLKSHFVEPELSSQAADGSSWRLQILGLITSPPVYYDPDAAWNSQVNQKFRQWPCFAYCLPSRSSSRTLNTHIFAITGSDTAFDPESDITLSNEHASLILAMDVGDSDTHWMEPGDYDVNALRDMRGKLNENLVSSITNRYYVLFADGEIWCLSGETPIEKLIPFFTIKNCTRFSREKLAAFRLDRWETTGVVGHE